MRIGYFGGTFDPPHRAHLAVALAAAGALRLDEVLLVPTGRQPLKQKQPAASYADRVAMTRLLCANDSRLTCSEMDTPHKDGSPNYTVQTLEKLTAEHPRDEIYAILGADSFLNLRSWKDPDRLLELAQWIVVSRPEFDFREIETMGLTNEQRDRVHLLKGVDDDTSSTTIRERLQLGISPGDRLTPEVLLYISRLHLYHPER